MRSIHRLVHLLEGGGVQGQRPASGGGAYYLATRALPLSGLATRVTCYSCVAS